MDYKIYEKNGVITAELPLDRWDGTQLIVSGSERLDDTYRELGFEPLGEYWYPAVGWNPFKDVGKFVRKVAKNKAFKKVLKVSKDILKSPITTAALGLVTGGAAVPALAAANISIRLAEAATKGGKKGDMARNLLKAANQRAEQEEAKAARLDQIKQVAVQKGLLTPQNLAELAAKNMQRQVLQSRASARAAQQLPVEARAIKNLVDFARI